MPLPLIDNDVSVIESLDFEEDKACEMSQKHPEPEAATMLAVTTCCGRSLLLCGDCSDRILEFFDRAVSMKWNVICSVCEANYCTPPKVFPLKP